MINVTIDGHKIQVSEGTSVLEAARRLDINIPTLCHIPGMDAEGFCRVCVVELVGARNLVPACAFILQEGMKIITDSPRVFNARRQVLDLLLSKHNANCFACYKHGDCLFHRYCLEYGLQKSSYEHLQAWKPIDDSNPFYNFDPNKCILCRKCERICAEKQCVEALALCERGFDNHIAPAFDAPLGNSACVSCGNCLTVCPTGALYPKTLLSGHYNKMTETVCPYCGVGCKMGLLTHEGRVMGVQPLKGAANDGLMCVKGRFAYNFIQHPDRLKKPLIRKNGKLTEASWEEAYDVIIKAWNKAKAVGGGSAIAGLASARCTNEENYLFQKLLRGLGNTNNIDHCARLCHASTVAGLQMSFGSGAMTNSIAEITDMDVIFVIGSNTTETHPVIATKMRQAAKKGAVIIVAEPRRIELCNDAQFFLQIKPGTNVALLNGMLKAILEAGLENKNFINERTEGFNELKAYLDTVTVEECAEICRVEAALLRKAAETYARAKNAGIFYAMGITQHSTGTDGVRMVANLAMLCGQIGKEASGVNPLRGQNNVQGSCDMAALPGDLPGYQKVADPKAREKFSKAWGLPVPETAGKTVSEIFNAIDDGEIKFLYIMGENPMVSDPDLNHLEKVLAKIPFLLVQDIFLNETAAFADVVLPAASFAEKDGTFTNTERRVQCLHKAVKLPGEAKADWQIITELMNKLGYKASYSHPAEIMAEINALTPSYGGITYNRLENGEGLQWPCLNEEHKGTKFLHKDKFTRGLGAFAVCPYTLSREVPDTEYPFILTTGRVLYQYHTRTMTGKSAGVQEIAGEPYVEINRLDAHSLGIANGDKVTVSSRRGSVITTAKVVETIGRGVLFMPFHYSQAAANRLTNKALDPYAKIPELKVCAVKIYKA